MLTNKLSFLFFLGIILSSNSQTKLDSLLNSFNSASSIDVRYEILDPLTTEMVRNNHPDRVKYLDSLITYALKRKDYDKAAQKSRFIVYELNRNLKYDESFKLIDSLLQYKQYFKNPKSEAHLLLKKGGVHFSLTEFSKAIDNYQQSIPLFNKSKDSIFVADAEYFSGQAYYLNGDFSLAIQSFDKARNLYDILGDTQYSNLVALESINLLNSNGLKEIGQKRYKELLEIARSSEDKCLTAIVYLNILSGELNSTIASSISYQDVQTSIDQCDNPFQNLRHKFYLKIQQVKDAVKNNKEDEASQLFNDLLTIEKELNDPYELSYSIKAKVAYYRYIGNLNKGITAVNEYFEITKNYPLNNLRVDIEKLASDLYADINNITRSKKHLDTYVKFKDSLYTASAANSYSFYQTQFETAQKENEIIKHETAIQKLEIEKTKTTTWYIFLIALIIIILGIGYYFLERSARKRRYLDKKLKLRKEELIGFTQRLLEKSNEHDKLKTEFEHLKELYGDEEELKELNSLAYSKILTTDDWADFKRKFQSVYPKFFIQLKNTGHKFTTAEERLITLEKLELSSYEIANMLGISAESVNTSRYRLRKKINAPKDISVVAFLENN